MFQQYIEPYRHEDRCANFQKHIYTFLDIPDPDWNS